MWKWSKCINIKKSCYTQRYQCKVIFQNPCKGCRPQTIMHVGKYFWIIIIIYDQISACYVPICSLYGRFQMCWFWSRTQISHKSHIFLLVSLSDGHLHHVCCQLHHMPHWQHTVKSDRCVSASESMRCLRSMKMIVVFCVIGSSDQCSVQTVSASCFCTFCTAQKYFVLIVNMCCEYIFSNGLYLTSYATEYVAMFVL